MTHIHHTFYLTFYEKDMAHDHSAHMEMNMSDHSAHDHSMHHGMDHSNMHQEAIDHSGMHHADVDHSTMHHGNMAHTMIMYFHSGCSETILFKQWQISSVGGLIGSMIGIIIMAALYEGLKYYREYLFWKTYNALQYRSVSMPQDKNVVAEDNRVVQPTMLSWMHTFQTFLHIVQIVLSYFLMLIFMTYNVWLCFAVVLGAAIGYFLFGWKKSVIVDVTEHCH
ncbi:high affinity copper uptake protein 1 isoform X2 [Chelonus insularis]|uniref:high affinity copper uptake protein 1 isoform X2 n=1 Tax=Chelonus insularis TaxID=460826 RepID=UPI00158C15AE|nr:high affinity copper uptake protein 1 isoform X2 [Chelonus insularis]